MTRTFASLISLACACAISGCVSSRTFKFPPDAETWRPPVEVRASVGDAIDDEPRKSPPPLVATRTRPIGMPVEVRLTNGIRAILLQRRDFPAVSAVLTLDRGAAASAPGAVATYARAMFGKSDEYDSGEAFSYLQFVGAFVGASVDEESMMMSVTALSPFFGSAMSRAAPMFVAPSLDSDSVEWAHRAIQARRAAAREDPFLIADEALGRALFPSPHPWGVPVDGESSTFRRAKKGTELRERVELRKLDEAMERFRDGQVVAERITVVCVGDMPVDSMERILERDLAKAPTRASAPTPAIGAVTPRPGEPILIVDRPGAPQSNLAIGWAGPRATDDDVVPVEVLAAATGSDLGSRLNVIVRRDYGATYGVRTTVHAGRDIGTITIRAAIETDRTAESVRRLLVEIERTRAEEMTPDALASGKLKAHYALEQGTAHGLARLFAHAIARGRSVASVVKHDADVERVTAAEVRAAANKYLWRDAMRLVIVGDARRIAEPIRALGISDVVIYKP
ncbi:MAG: insulinase family protein [Labilithrix sp.]|nr:insulinase family protein [Labilithrix sp.]